MKARHGLRWLHYASRSAGQGPSEPLDIYGLCKTIIGNWNEVFAQRFDRKTTHKARRIFSTLLDGRNAASACWRPIERRRRAQLPACHVRSRHLAESDRRDTPEAEGRLRRA